MELFLDYVVDGLSSITQDTNLPKDEWTTLVGVAAICDEIAAAGRTDDVKGEVTWNPTTDAVAYRKRVAQKNGEAASSDEETEPTARTPTTEPQAPNMDVTAMKEAKRLSRKRRRTANRMKKRAATSVYVTGFPSDATFDDLAE